ncbi:MAG TPA: 3-deoxy-D-manno-octulosonic acid transferase [Acidobacteriaceae bacterium]|jgi:3-deoxy-D-manno-octulosonic-acid transferase|nr:3-deoxy-D-manno-octulosonic acid transferase [Acidobacteriaceae bacterium]
MLIVYSVALLLVLVAGSPWWLLRMATSGKYREGLAERLGRVPQRIRKSPGSEPRIWIHAVSVGEVLAASRLVEELGRRLTGADSGQGAAAWRVMISTTTRTGQRLARERFGADRVFYFPLDFAWAVRAWLRAVRPRMLVLAETEFWPRMLAECRRAGIPVAVVNARISDRSWPRYRRLAWMWRRMLGGIAVALAQSDLDEGRLRALGVKNVQVAGNLKFDVRVARPAAVTTLLREHLASAAAVLVCGSTLAGEEEMLLDARPASSVMILAPRHPERFGEVANLLERGGARWVRRSDWIEAPAQIEPGTVFLLDSIGELASVYSLATAAFVGGSLVPAGGHNPLEAAQFSVPVAMGTSYENFRGIVETLRARKAIRLLEGAGLASALVELLSGSPDVRAMGARGREVFESEAGATERSVQALLQVLELRPAHPEHAEAPR